MSAPAKLSARNLVKSYKKRNVVRDVSLEVTAASLIAGLT